MAFPDSLTIKNAANVDCVFARLHDDKVQSTYVLTTSTPSEPLYLIIQKDMGKSASGVDRYLAKFQATVLVGGVPVMATRNNSLASNKLVPRAVNDDLLAFDKNFHTSENFTKQLRGEI